MDIGDIDYWMTKCIERLEMEKKSGSDPNL